MARLLKNAEQEWQQETLAGLLKRHALPANAQPTAEQIPTINLDQVVQRAGVDLPSTLAPHGSSLALGPIAGYTTKRLLAGPAMQSGRQILRRFAVRLGIQATRSAAAGAGTSVVATPIGGAVVTGISMAITARTEYISLKREETKQRPAMEAELHDNWGELESQIRQTLEARRQARGNALLERLNHQATQAVKTSDLPDTYRILG